MIDEIKVSMSFDKAAVFLSENHPGIMKVLPCPDCEAPRGFLWNKGRLMMTRNCNCLGKSVHRVEPRTLFALELYYDKQPEVFQGWIDECTVPAVEETSPESEPEPEPLEDEEK